MSTVKPHQQVRMVAPATHETYDTTSRRYLPLDGDGTVTVWDHEIPYLAGKGYTLAQETKGADDGGQHP